jgi:hypothetical protein
MTPERAADLLGVADGATAVDIEHAFARRARATHPDVAPVIGDAADAAAAFREAMEARDVLLARLRSVTAPHDGVRPPVFVAPYSSEPMRRPHGPALTAFWMLLVVIGASLSIYDAEAPLTIAEPIARWVLLGAALLGYSLTGRTPLLVAAVVLIVLSAVWMVVVTTIGTMLGMFITLPAAFGLLTSGVVRRKLQLRAAAAATAARATTA